MRASWFALHTSFCRHLNLRSSDADFDVMRHAYPELAPVSSIASFMEHQHTHGGDPAARFGVVRTLVQVAQSDHLYRSTAHLMVVVALWPGLDAVLWRLARAFPDGRDDLPADIIARVGEAILTLDLARVRAVVATLLRNVERDIRRDRIARRVIDAASRAIDDPEIETLAATSVPRDMIDDRVLHDYLSTLTPEDANLLRRVFILGETQEEAGHALGLKHDAARKRFQRSIAKLQAQQKNPPALSHSASPDGL